jgi:hypothetical protein
MRRLILGHFAFLLALACNCSSAQAAEKPLGLTVRDKTLMLEGKPYRGVGVNYFSLFSRLLADPNDTSSLTNLAALSRAKIPFVRFMCGGFWSAEQKLYLTNREAFFERLDRVVHCAETNHVGLVPSLFWNLPTVPDLAGEPMQELGNTNSRSIAFIRAYTTDVVSRYRSSRAIWAWEFGNEGSLSADLPNAAEHRPPIVPELGTPKQRTELDELKSGQLQVAFGEFARTIRRLDPERLVLSGNALPRVSAWHNTHEKNWKSDDAEQFREVLRRDNPDPMNGISIHIYPGELFPAGATNLAETVTLVAQEAVAAGKPLFVGEFGVSRRTGSIENQKRIFGDLLVAIENAHVPLAAAWVFDFPGQDQDWSITFQNDRAFFLKMISETNQRIRSRH